jgi:hypothetical protein
MGSDTKLPDQYAQRDEVASGKRAALIRAQWSDYKQRFRPVEDKLISDMGSGIHSKFNQEGLENAQKSVNTAYGGAVDMQNRDMARMGITNNAQQQQAMDATVDINKSQSMDNATNSARQWDIDRKNAVISGGLGNTAQSLGQK